MYSNMIIDAHRTSSVSIVHIWGHQNGVKYGFLLSKMAEICDIDISRTICVRKKINPSFTLEYTVANEIVRTPKKNAVKRKQKDQFCSNWF